MKKILDVGCGDAKRVGSIGIDKIALPGVDIVHDLTLFPWPIESSSFDEVYLTEVIEHLPDTIRTMEEIHRILKPGGKLYIRVVYWNHHHSVSDPTHVSFFNEISWDFFVGKRKSYYMKVHFSHIEKLDFTYDQKARKYFLFNKWLMKKASYFLCNIIDGMEVVLVK